jgi:uncharacterized protein
MTPRPQFSTLDRAAIDAILARQHVGRLAFSLRDRVDIEPLHYVYADGWLYARTQLGTKLSTVVHNPWVAMEVDEIRSLFDWDSVVVRGRLELLDDSAHDAARERYRRAVAALRTLVPEALTDDDPTPERQILCAIYVDEVEGRSARPAGAA